MLFASIAITLTGCDQNARILLNTLSSVIGTSYYYSTTTPWDEKHQWKAEEFFDDSKVVALCKAIEAKDLKEIDRLVAAGADVNAKGKGNMTPLLWAFPENKPEVFKKILEYGADPNVALTSHIDPPGPYGIEEGDSVLHLAARTAFPNHFKYVMQHGGDPNLVRERLTVMQWFPHASPLIAVIRGKCPDKKEAIQLLVDAGADLDYRNCKNSLTAVMQTVSECQFDLTLQFLEAGASFNVFKGDGDTFVSFLMWKTNGKPLTPEQKKGLAEVFAWLEANGADIEGTKRQLEWKEQNTGSRTLPARLAELEKRCEEELAVKKILKEREAGDYFDDPKVIALCKAIETKDITEIDRLVADGVDINAKGKGNVTPLLWAFPGGGPAVFKRLLEHGADPHVEVTSDFDAGIPVLPGDSVLHLAAANWSPIYFKHVMQHGGNPNFVSGNGQNRTVPLTTIIRGRYSYKQEAIQLLIDAGADLDYRENPDEFPILGDLVSNDYNFITDRLFRTGTEHDLAIQLLKGGASFNIHKESGETIVHLILRQGYQSDGSQSLRDARENSYVKVLEWLVTNGADIENAKKDFYMRWQDKRWEEADSPGISISCFHRVVGRLELSPERVAEIKQRYADELAAKRATRE